MHSFFKSPAQKFEFTALSTLMKSDSAREVTKYITKKLISSRGACDALFSRSFVSLRKRPLNFLAAASAVPGIALCSPTRFTVLRQLITESIAVLFISSSVHENIVRGNSGRSYSKRLIIICKEVGACS